MKSSTSLPASATVCSVSASSAGDPVSAAATPFASAIVVFAASAASTLRRLSSGATSGCGAATLIGAGDATAMRHNERDKNF